MEAIPLHNISTLCRICLSKTDIMSELLDFSNGLYDVLSTIVNIELEENEAFPKYLCRNCVSKISVCQELISRYKETNELLQRCKYKTKVTLESVSLTGTAELTDESDDNNGIPVQKCKQEDFQAEDNKMIDSTISNDGNKDTLLQSHQHYDSKMGDTGITLGSLLSTQAAEVDTPNDSDGSSNAQEVESDNPDENQKIRLKQFPVDEVIGEIDGLKKKLNSVRKCVACNFEGRNFRALSIHMSHVHKDKRNKWCPTCNKMFDDVASHSVTLHHEKGNTCRFCKKNLSSHSHLLEHLAGHANIRPYKCNVCHKTFASSRHLHVHDQIHLQRKCFACKICNTEFSQVHLLKIHLEKVHNFTTCAGCEQIFTTDEAFRQHSCRKNDVEDISGAFSNVLKQNYCTLCKKNVRSLSVHIRNYHEYPSNGCAPNLKLCTVCGKQFKSNYKLKIHMRIHTGETPYQCSYCDRKMSTRNHLVVHERTHTGEKPHVCPVCKKAFTQTSILNTHIKLHMGRPEKCMICEQSFCRAAELKVHMRKHTGERPYTCGYCEKGFSQKSHLVVHARGHTKDKPYKCDFCGKTFGQRSVLNSHINIHLGEKPFKCTLCPYACRQSYRLTVHMKQHLKPLEERRPNECCYCSRSFSTEAALESHLTNVHFVCLSQ